MNYLARLAFLFLILQITIGFTFLGNLKIPQLNEIKAKMDADKKFGTKKLVLITGTSSGLGKHTTKQLLKDGGYHVIGAVRDLDKMAAVAEAEEFDMKSFTPMKLDLASFQSTR